MKKYGGVITDWQIHNMTFSVGLLENIYGEGVLPMVFTGTVLKDSPKFEDGFHMKSSLIVNIDRKNGKIETLNTIYDVDLETEGNDVFPDLGNGVTDIYY